MFVKPNDGRSVIDPGRGDLLPPAGRVVEPSQYWYRRQLDGDVVINPPPEQVGNAEHPTIVVSKKGAK